MKNEFFTAKVTCSSDSEELVKLAKKQKITLPSDHLGAFKTVYARIGNANRNKVRLSREAVDKALPSLIGSQININHWRQNWTVGSIFWAKINNNDEIEIAFTFFKDVYKKEFEIATALFDKGELTVSFELNVDPDTIEFNKDGTRTLNDITFVGCGLLLDEDPAEPTAIVFEMAKRIVTKLIQNDTPELVFAKEAVINCKDLLETINNALEEKEKSNTTLDSQKDNAKENKEVNDKNIDEDFEEGGNQMKKDEDKKVEDVKAEETSQEAVEEKAESKVDDKVEESTEEKVEDKAKETSDEKAEEKEEAELKVITETNEVVTETMDENSDTVKVESETKQTVERDGEKVSEMTEKVDVERTYTFAEVEAIKAEYEATIETLKASLEGKDEEIEVAKEKAVKVEKLKAELGEYVKDFSDEDFDNKDKIENARLKKENDKLKANSENKEVKEETSKEEEIPEEEKVETASLETGHTETPEYQGNPLVSYLKEKKSKK